MEHSVSKHRSFKSCLIHVGTLLMYPCISSFLGQSISPAWHNTREAVPPISASLQVDQALVTFLCLLGPFIWQLGQVPQYHCLLIHDHTHNVMHFTYFSTKQIISMYLENESNIVKAYQSILPIKASFSKTYVINQSYEIIQIIVIGWPVQTHS